MPIVLVTGPEGQRIVNAKSQTAAINHVVGSLYTTKTLNASELYEYIQKGVAVEDADAQADGPEAAEAPAPTQAYEDIESSEDADAQDVADEAVGDEADA